MRSMDHVHLATPALATLRAGSGPPLGRPRRDAPRARQAARPHGGLGFEMRSEATLRTLTEDVVKTSEIEGEILAPDQVRSSIARRLGLDAGGLPAPDRAVDGVVEMTLDATRNYAEPLTEERLFSWHAALFPTGRSGMRRIRVARWRDDADGPMQVVSGPLGRQRVPPPGRPKHDRTHRVSRRREPGTRNPLTERTTLPQPRRGGRKTAPARPAHGRVPRAGARRPLPGPWKRAGRPRRGCATPADPADPAPPRR